MTIITEYRMKCEDCQEVQYAESEYADCECGGFLQHIEAFAVINEAYD